MPLVRIDLREGKDATYREELGQIVHEALVSVGVPKDDLFRVISEHEPPNLVFDPTYLGIRRSEDLVIIQITWNEGRTVEQKKALYKAIADGLAGKLGLRRRTSSSASSRSRRRTGRSAMGLRNTPELLANAIGAARAVAFDVEMHVVGVEGVGARPENGGEPAASRGAYRPEIGGFVGARRLLDEEAPLVRERNRSEVHRQSFGVGADPGARDSVLGPAIIAGAGFDCGDLGAQHRLPERRDNEADVVGEHEREFAVEQRTVGQAHDVAVRQRDRRQTDRRSDPATLGIRGRSRCGLRAGPAGDQLREASLTFPLGPDRRGRLRSGTRRRWPQLRGPRRRQRLLSHRRATISREERKHADRDKRSPRARSIHFGIPQRPLV